MSETNAIAVLPPAQRAAIVLKSAELETELKTLAASTADITEVKDDNGRQQVHSAGMALIKKRTGIRKDGKTARDDANLFTKAVIAEEDRLVGFIEPEEKRLIALRDAWDAEQARIEAEKIAAERRRTEAHEAAIANILTIPVKLAGCTSAEIDQQRQGLATVEPGDEWEEFRERAVAAYAETLAKVNELHAAAIEREEAARKAAAEAEAERQRVEAEKAELARQKAEQDRIAAEQRAEAERLQRQANEQAEALRLQQEEFHRQQAEFQAKLRAQQEEHERRQREIEEAAKPTEAPTEAPASLSDTVVGLPFNPPAEFPDDVTVITGKVAEYWYKEQAPADDRRITLGQLSALFKIGDEEFKLSAGFLNALGFAHTPGEKSAKLYNVRDIPAICAALTRHIQTVSEKNV